jgi:hypothetical protein
MKEKKNAPTKMPPRGKGYITAWRFGMYRSMPS